MLDRMSAYGYYDFMIGENSTSAESPFTEKAFEFSYATNPEDSQDQELTPEELAYLGTHEYKLDDWFTRFKKLIDISLHTNQAVGRIALSLAIGSV